MRSYSWSHLFARAFTVLTVVFGVTAVTHATSPGFTTVQGQVKDSSGVPLPNGTYDMVFNIWNDPTANDPNGDLVWTSNTVSVAVSGGVFTVNLGEPPMPALDESHFSDTNRWLGVTIGADPELSPRIRMGTGAYAFRAGRLTYPGGAPGQILKWDGSIWTLDADLQGISETDADDRYVLEAGDTISGSLAIAGDLSVGVDSPLAPLTVQAQDNWIHYAGNGWGDFSINNGVMGLGVGVALGGGGAGRVHFWSRGGPAEDLQFTSPSFGPMLNLSGAGLHELWGLNLIFRDTGSVAGVGLTPGSSQIFAIDSSGSARSRLYGTGELKLMEPDGFTEYIGLDARSSGDDAVRLPFSAISALEMLNEAGIASNAAPGITTLAQVTTSVVDVCTLSIILPSPGYVVLDGKCTGVTSGTLDTNWGLVQIDQSAGGIMITTYTSIFGLSAHSGTDENYFPVYVTRTYFLGAGLHTFRMEATASFLNSAGAVTEIWDPILQAQFFPTSYGTVVTTRAMGDENDLPAEAMELVRPRGLGGTTTVERVDLRELELRAARARAEALRLEKEVMAKKLRNSADAHLLEHASAAEDR